MDLNSDKSIFRAVSDDMERVNLGKSDILLLNCFHICEVVIQDILYSSDHRDILQPGNQEK